MQYKTPVVIITGITAVVGLISYLYIKDLFRVDDINEDD